MASQQPNANSDDEILAEIMAALIDEGAEVDLARLITATLREEVPAIPEDVRMQIAAITTEQMLEEG